VGTGFFLRYERETGHGPRAFPVLVTNKHVLKDALDIRILFHRADVSTEHRKPSTNWDYIHQHDIPAEWIDHHDDDIDLCALPLAPLIRKQDEKGDHLYWMEIGENLIPTDEALSELRVMEHVVMVGYPDGLYDEEHGFPIFRHGMTAAHPHVDYNGEPTGAVDIAMVGGSSGSPILGYRPDIDYSAYLLRPNYPILLGVLTSGPTVTEEGEFKIADLPTVSVPQFSVETELFMHLGYYVKARELWSLKETIFSTIYGQGK
jgi:hypothetical protein